MVTIGVISNDITNDNDEEKSDPNTKKCIKKLLNKIEIHMIKMENYPTKISLSNYQNKIPIILRLKDVKIIMIIRNTLARTQHTHIFLLVFFHFYGCHFIHLCNNYCGYGLTLLQIMH